METRVDRNDATDLLVTRGDGLLEAGMDGEMLGLHIDSGVCFGFNATAYRVWQLAEHPTTLSRICSAIAEEYAVDAATCRDDVRAALEGLASDGLVTLTRAG